MLPPVTRARTVRASGNLSARGRACVDFPPPFGGSRNSFAATVFCRERLAARRRSEIVSFATALRRRVLPPWTNRLRGDLRTRQEWRDRCAVQGSARGPTVSTIALVALIIAAWQSA